MSPSIEAELVSSDDDTEQEEVTLPGSEQEESIAISSETGSAYKLGPHDVLLGRGLGTYNHVGNIKFRKLVNENKLRYVAASKVDKPKVAKELVQLWRNLSPPGRFLARREDSAKEVSASVPEEDNWVEVGDKKAQEKTSQCLRERTPDILPFYKFKRACKNERKQALRVHQITPPLKQQQNARQMDLQDSTFSLVSPSIIRELRAGQTPVAPQQQRDHAVALGMELMLRGAQQAIAARLSVLDNLAPVTPVANEISYPLSYSLRPQVSRHRLPSPVLSPTLLQSSLPFAMLSGRNPAAWLQRENLHQIRYF